MGSRLLKKLNSERKYKAKIKEWGMRKNIPLSDMMVVNSKVTKRAREDGKDTLFIVGGVPAHPQRLTRFQKRKFVKNRTPKSPCAGSPTPPFSQDIH